jgi:hypothetical protein
MTANNVIPGTVPLHECEQVSLKLGQAIVNIHLRNIAGLAAADMNETRPLINGNYLRFPGVMPARKDVYLNLQFIHLMAETENIQIHTTNIPGTQRTLGTTMHT